MSARTLTCPGCGAPVTFRASFCAYCRAPLAEALAPALARGAPIKLLDLKSGISLPGAQHATPRLGLGLDFELPQAALWREAVGPPMRDSVAVVAGTCRDASGAFGVATRCHTLGEVLAGYRVVLRPALREYAILRFAGWQNGSYVEEIQKPRACEAIVGVGKRNVVEIRSGDSLFSVLINGQPVQTFEDAHFVFGQNMWVVGAAAPGARVNLDTVEVWELA